MELCKNCGEEIRQFNLTKTALEITGGQQVKIIRLSCPSCNHVQHTFADDTGVADLVRRVEALEGKVIS